MKKAYILHGCCDKEEYLSDEYPSPSNFHWLPWLQKQLLVQGYSCQTPEMPDPYKGDFSAWKSIFDAFLIDDQTSLIGHSCGGGFLLRWLSENEKTIDKLILVAPSLDLHKKYGDFLQGPVDPKLQKRIHEIHVLYSDNETVTGVKETVDLITEMFLESQLHLFTDKKHFRLRDLGTEKFPELLSLLS